MSLVEWMGNGEAYYPIFGLILGKVSKKGKKETIFWSSFTKSPLCAKDMFLLDDVQYVIGVFKANFGTLFKPDFFRDRSIKILSFSALQGKDTYTSAYVMYVKIDQCHITSLGHATNPSGGRPSLAPFSTEIGSAVGR